ncbi:hypothetical protein ACHAXR_001247 [Thalassiosira sp. AJA248-18]
MASNIGSGGNGKGGGDNHEVQYFDSDFSFEEHAADCSIHWGKKSDRGGGGSTAALATEDHNGDHLHPQSQSKFWDAFHSHHSAGNFYKPRRYLIKSFPCILEYFEHGIIAGSTTRGDGDGELQEDKELQEANEDNRILLEIGCGSGSSCIPIIKHFSEMKFDNDDVKCFLLACDSSPVAVETTRRSVGKIMMMEKEEEESTADAKKKILFGPVVADPSLSEEESAIPFRAAVESAYYSLISDDDVGIISCEGRQQGGIVGIVLMVFVLSAVTPSRVGQFLEQVYQTTTPGGKVCFRDYGMYDMPMLRFDPAAAVCKTASTTSEYDNDPVFVRGEGTIARFFSIETTKGLFESAGFTTGELRYCTVFNHNRKTGQKLKRVFVHGVFEKPMKPLHDL